jgi:hypothetical protein
VRRSIQYHSSYIFAILNLQPGMRLDPNHNANDTIQSRGRDSTSQGSSQSSQAPPISLSKPLRKPQRTSVQKEPVNSSHCYSFVSPSNLQVSGHLFPGQQWIAPNRLSPLPIGMSRGAFRLAKRDRPHSHAFIKAKEHLDLVTMADLVWSRGIKLVLSLDVPAKSSGLRLVEITRLNNQISSRRSGEAGFKWDGFLER